MTAVPSPTPPLHPWITTDPAKEVVRLEREAFKWSLLSKITFVALGAIALAALVATVTAQAGSFPFVLVGLMLSTPLFAAGASFCQAKGWQLRAEANRERLVIKEYEPEKHYKYPFLQARFAARRKEKKDSLEKAAQLITQAKTLCRNPKDLQIQMINRQIAWGEVEKRGAPAALEAALAMEIIENPSTTIALSAIGACRPRPIEGYFDPADPYFFFHDEKRTPLTLKDVIDLSERDLRAKLFSPTTTA